MAVYDHMAIWQFSSRIQTSQSIKSQVSKMVKFFFLINDELQLMFDCVPIHSEKERY